MHTMGSYMAQTPGRRTSQESSRGPWTFRKPNTIGSQGVCFALLDVGLSQFMPNTRQSVRFCLRYTVKQPYLLTKVKLGKVDEEIEHLNAHCFTTCNKSQSKWSNTRMFCPIWFKIISFQDHCTFAVNLTFLDAIGRFPAKSSISH